MTDYDIMRKLLLSTTGFDIGFYKPDQMHRIVSTMMARSGAKSIQEYAMLLRKDSKRIQDFKHYITINVSEFFRDKKMFEYLHRGILRPLLKNNSEPAIWSAGCALGEEPYSLAILLEELEANPNVCILATDIDEESLEKAKMGIYSRKSLNNVPLSWMKKYFTPVRDSFQVNANLKKRVQFLRHDLLSAKQDRFELILCRNVVIYFNPECRDQVYRNICKALKPNGVLFIGSTETLLNYRQLGLEKIETYFYRKPLI